MQTYWQLGQHGGFIMLTAQSLKKIARRTDSSPLLEVFDVDIEALVSASETR